MTSGFILIHRSLWEHPVFRNFTEAAVFAWLISKAAWKPTKIRYKDRVLNLERGQLSISLRDLARQTGWKIKRGQGFLKKLEKGDMVSIEKGTGVTVITICNYNKYQPDERRPGTPIGDKAAHPPHALRTQNNEVNEGKTKQGRGRAREPSGAGTHPLDSKKKDPGETGKYRSQMTARERKAFDRKVGKLMSGVKVAQGPPKRPERKSTHVAMSPEDREAGLKTLEQMNRSP